MGAPLRTIEPGNPIGPAGPAAPFSPVGPSKPYRIGRNEEIKVKNCQGGKFCWYQFNSFQFQLFSGCKFEI